DVALGTNHGCALATTGKVYCWGSDDHDQLGDGTGKVSAVPIVVAGVSDARAIAAGSDHTCVVLGDGTPRCWGASVGSYGEAIAQPTLTNVAQVSGGKHHTCALDAAGSVRCWGSNINHQLGTA